MAILPIIIAPDPILKTKSERVETVDDALRSFIADLFYTMYNEEGIGLAAVQVGVLKRVLVADVTWRTREEMGGVESGKQYVLINPEIVEDSPEINIYKEGCLSFPGQFSEVSRPTEVRVRYQDLSGAAQEETFTDLLATCIQHEIDHLNGVTFVDHISSVKRDMILRKLTKQKKQGVFDHDHHEHVHGEHCNHG